MPIQRIDREAVPYVRPAYEPDTRTLRDLLAMAGQARAQQVGRRGQVKAQGWMTLGDIISSGIQSYQDRKAQEGALALKAQEARDKFEQEAADRRLRQNEIGLREMTLNADLQQRQDTAARQAREDAQKMGDARATAIGYGPMAESDVDTVMQSPSRSGDVRYAFGPGTAEGPELMPTAPQRKAIADEQAVVAAGGRMIDGRPWMPPKPEREPNPTEYSLALLAEGDDPVKARAAARALARVRALRQDRQGATPDQKFVIRNGQVIPIAAGQAQPGDIPYSADAMQGMGGEASDARSTRTAAALNSIDQLKTLAPKRLPGLPGMVQGAAASVAGLAGYNSEARQYNALLQPTAMQMAVAIQGASGLSNAERETMAGMLGKIETMDYETQMALLERASQMLRSGADVDYVTVKDARTGQPVQQWVPKRSRMPMSVNVPGLGGGSVPNTVTTPDGQVFTFPTAEAAAAFRARIGGK